MTSHQLLGDCVACGQSWVGTPLPREKPLIPSPCSFLHARASHSADGETEARQGFCPWNATGSRLTLKK